MRWHCAIYLNSLIVSKALEGERLVGLEEIRAGLGPDDPCTAAHKSDSAAGERALEDYVYEARAKKRRKSAAGRRDRKNQIPAM